MEGNDNPVLQAKLNELEQEFEEGDLTEKGYQKRRTLLLSQFLGSSPIAAELKGLRIHSPDDTSHQSTDGSRSASLAALNHNSDPRKTSGYSTDSNFRPDVPPQSPARQSTARLDTMTSGYGGYGNGRLQDPFHKPPTPLQLGVHNPDQRPPLEERNSLFLPGPGDNQYDQSAEPSMTMGSGTMTSNLNYAFNPALQVGYQEQQAPYDESHAATMMDSHGTMLGDSQQGYFSDFAGQQGFESNPRQAYGGGPHRYSSSDAFSPTAAMAPPMLQTSDLPPPAALEYQMPLEPRDVPFAVFDPHDPNTPMSKFDNIAAALRHRSRTSAKAPAYWVLDGKGKEIASITWDKLTSRAEKVAQVIRDKSSLYRGDRVALIYRSTEIIDFAIALLGCFIAGVVAVPINDLEDYARLNVILTSTQAHLALTTDNNLKSFQRDITTQKLNWPRGVEWWKTNEFGSYHPKKKDEVPPLTVPDLAYIEFSRAPTGDLRGVVMSHRTIMHQMACLSAIISTVPSNTGGDTFNRGLRDKNGRLMTGSSRGEILLSYLDPRQGIGMIMGVLLTVYGGHTTVWMEDKAVETPGLYAHLITKYRATLMLADYPGLKRSAYNYQQDPMTTRNFKKGMEPNFQHVKLCLIDTLTVDSEFHEVLADRWLRPMRNPRARELVAPMLCLPEHGGMVISMRDWLGGEERMGCPLKLDMGSDGTPIEEKTEEKEKAPGNGFGSLIGGGTTPATEQQVRTELSEVLLDREALKTNEVVVVAIGDDARKKASSEPGTVRVGAFGFPIPDATLAVVDPETGLLASPHSVGEIWVDSPSLSGGFWALPKHTEQIFHARPYKFEPGDPTPMMVEPEFLRTGLLGTVIEGKVFVLGLYEDRLRQKVEWVEHGTEIAEHRYFFVQHIIVSIMRNLGQKVYDCSAFDIFVNDEHLPIVLIESQAASTAPTTSGGPPRQLDTALLDSLSERCMEVLMQEHHLRVYCVMITAPNSLPKVLKNGRREIGNMLCRREFDLGNLPCVHVKFGVERAVLNLPVGIDPMGGIWSPEAAETRQAILQNNDRQYSGIDRREVVIDDRTSTPLNNFTSIVDLLQWRVARQAEELSYCTIDGRGKEGKGITWKKFDTKVAAVAMYLKNKVKIRAGDHIILMYTHSEDFVYAVHACFVLGATAIPMAPLDQNRLNEDAPAFLHMVADYTVRAVLVNQDVDHLLKQKMVSQHLKSSAQILKVHVPSIYNTSKPPKQNNGCRELNLTMQPAWVQPGYPVLVWTYWTPDQRRIAVQLGHDTIMGMCKVQKETCQMTSSRPVLGCVRSTIGLGFIHTCLMGIFVGAPTYLVSPVEFAQNPVSLFLTLARYKVKDTYATPQMLDHAMAMMPGKGFALHEMKNMMISAEGRPRVDVFQKVRLHFAATGLDRTAINTIYSHVLNPMVASRSYMCIEPIELWLDPQALRRGMIYPVDPDTEPKALLLQDSGMVPVSTQIAIVNPESRMLCHDGEYGEIWVDSEACVKSFYGSKDPFDGERFDGRLLDGDQSVQYVRTGDLGFLYNVSRPIGPNGAQVEMQVLFVLGNIGETFEINGLSHFPMDIENSIEKCHRNIVPGGSAVFQAGGLVVVLVEVARKAYLASIVPVIVNAILNDHQIVVDIVAFVNKGDFPRSRLGEKQRGKILASWVTRKMRTMAQFGIRDADSAMSDITEAMEPRSSIASLKNGGAIASSLRNVEPAPQILEEEQQQQQMNVIANSAPLPTNILEMPAINYNDSTVGSPTGNEASTKSDDTPTDAPRHFELEDNQGLDARNSFTIPGFEAVKPATPPPRVGPKPTSPNANRLSSLPAVEGREGDLWSLPSQQTRAGGLRVQNASSDDDEDDSWKEDAVMHMNLAQ
ncbi:acetyl-CoA synthetase-like protein [Coleophoma cylindrospora]|uniref:Acetyl-CoA synthetase-like protein n=1 Tax=Coleophoma cylindrospora TaxID=1849047 RepID=A0A3D8RB83_9HELO|nr:acetyl-CoA synthetase-like protein [Coleophoma cylindrospora]